ncbi:5-deoxy-glucuronate isomerase [Acetonema longum]|uniref:Myo-inositol catabolism IolB domain protein n=1 Tax=Acetonema longum DSM 6540 TaxID=1009370 RepID=F7NLR7_9FIRM|nr:5-deoxy-glucuronate isomerase [Acetonema longum]EGO63008.1 Myo-inositol catabolism IolB domain protein [Acetonema longum DSM 6540]
MLRIRQAEPFQYGYNPVTAMDETEDNTMMDFGILRIAKNQKESLVEEDKEIALLLIQGEVSLKWDGREKTIARGNCFDAMPWVLHVPKNTAVEIAGIAADSELSITKTTNDRLFAAKMYAPAECRSEERGKGTLKEASTRIVRTILDYSDASYSNLVIGEVIDFPGKWSSYPPHYHPQPEIYFYKFCPEQGYGFCELGEDIVKIRHNDTVKILNNATHPQTTAPGYAMYYIWVIRHIDGNPYKSPEYPVFEPQHLWVNDKNSKIWPDK